MINKNFEGDSVSEEVISKFCGKIEQDNERFQIRTAYPTKNKAHRKQLRGIFRGRGHNTKMRITFSGVGYRCINSPLPPYSILCAPRFVIHSLASPPLKKLDFHVN
jgi:hypothetical protein